jgi:hypothetical protein
MNESTAYLHDYLKQLIPFQVSSSFNDSLGDDFYKGKETVTATTTEGYAIALRCKVIDSGFGVEVFAVQDTTLPKARLALLIPHHTQECQVHLAEWENGKGYGLSALSVLEIFLKQLGFGLEELYPICNSIATLPNHLMKELFES